MIYRVCAINWARWGDGRVRSKVKVRVSRQVQVVVNNSRAVPWLAPDSQVKLVSKVKPGSRAVKLDSKVSPVKLDSRVKLVSKVKPGSRVVKQVAVKQAEVRRMASAIEWRA
jgi:hypothetical protein